MVAIGAFLLLPGSPVFLSRKCPYQAPHMIKMGIEKGHCDILSRKQC